ncbi:BEN domain-containing protein 5-like [Dermacentor variabilis]|uniref:BEN domain-containing protein 5-like n=1 Tax=Dermacentor variabilis TaxID=34621 RepID=UPI003F5CB61E
MTVPTHAYVRYHDGASALVAVGLIREFSPQSVSDVAKNKLVYWAAPGLEGEEAAENYYPADVVLLGVSKRDLISSMTRKRMAVPHTEFDCPPSLLVKSAVDPKLARQVTKEKLQLSKSTKQREILQKKRKRGSSHFSESDDEVVEKSLLKKEQRKNKQLEEKNRVLFERLKKEKKKNEELQALLTTKFDLLLTHLNDARPKLACVDSGMDFDYSNNDYIFLDVRPAAPAAASRDLAEFQNVVPAAPAAISAALPQQQGGDVPWHLPPFFEDDNGQVHIGHGIVIPSDKWAALMCVPRDSLFCKEGARCLWTAAELKERSVKGQICRRFVNNPDTTAKKPMTPKKLLALNSKCRLQVVLTYGTIVSVLTLTPNMFSFL